MIEKCAIFQFKRVARTCPALLAIATLVQLSNKVFLAQRGQRKLWPRSIDCVQYKTYLAKPNYPDVRLDNVQKTRTGSP
jgi:hypothetical protein